MSDLELAVEMSRTLERLLKAGLGAEGKGLGQQAHSVRDRLSEDTFDNLMRIAGIRNRVVHEGESIYSQDKFREICVELQQDLQRLSASPLPPRVQTNRPLPPPAPPETDLKPVVPSMRVRMRTLVPAAPPAAGPPKARPRPAVASPEPSQARAKTSPPEPVPASPQAQPEPAPKPASAPSNRVSKPIAAKPVRVLSEPPELPFTLREPPPQRPFVVPEPPPKLAPAPHRARSTKQKVQKTPAPSVEPLPSVPRPKRRKTGTLASATFLGMGEEHGVMVDHVLGMLIHLEFTVQRLKGVHCQAAAYFSSARGELLLDFNDRFCSEDGKVCVWEDFTPKFQDAHYTGFTLFMPYHELHLDGGHHELLYSIALHDVETRCQIALTEDRWFDIAFV